MPSWAGLSSVTPTTTTISRRDHGDGGDQHAHVRNGSGSDGHYYGKHNGDTHHIINDVNSSSSNINMPLSSSDIKGKGKGKALLPFQPLSQVTGAEGNHHHGPANGDTSNNTTDVMLSPEDGSDAESILEMTTEEAEALLWDAQMALISHQYQTGVALLEKAAKGGSSTACLSLANIYHKGLPCSTHHPHSNNSKKHATISPSKLVEGSISTDQVKTASYLLQALELEAAKATIDYDDLDLEVLSDASLLLCNMFRYGKIRPRDPSRSTAPMRELSISPEHQQQHHRQLKKSSSFLNPVLDESIDEHADSAWNRGGRLAKVLSEHIRSALQERGISWSMGAEGESKDEGNGSFSSEKMSMSLQDSDVERLDTILVSLYYILALVSGSREGTEAIQESIQYWKLLLASHAVFANLHISKGKHKHSSKNGGHAPVRQSSRSSPKLDDLISKAEKRLHLLETALKEHQQRPNGRRRSSNNVHPRDIIMRRDTTSEYSGSSLLFSPTSETSIQFDPSSSSHSNGTTSPKPDKSPSSNIQTSDKSIDTTACSCELPIPPSPSSRKQSPRSPQSEKTPQKKRGGAKFAIHDSPASIMSAQPASRIGHPPTPSNRQKTVPPALFRGFQNPSSANLRQSLAGQSTSSSHLSLADLASTVSSSIAPTSTYRRPPGGGGGIGDLRRPLLDRKASQMSLASTTAFGRRAWAGPAGRPLSRVSNLSSASLHTLAPTTTIDRHASEIGVLSLPHSNNTTKSQPVNAAHVLSSSLRSSTSAAVPGPSNYTGKLRHVVSSLGSFFTSTSPQTATSEDSSKAKAELEKVAEQHDAEVENFYCWGEEDRTSSEEESLHSGSPSNKGDADSVIQEEDVDVAEEPEAEPWLSPSQPVPAVPRNASVGRQGRTGEAIPQRPVYPLSTSISSSYLHASTPRSSPRRGRMPSFQSATGDASSSSGMNGKGSAEIFSPATPSSKPPSNGVRAKASPRKPTTTKIDPLLAALEANSRVNVTSRCAICGIQGVNFPACHRCGMTFCSRDCRMASGGEAGKHICQTEDQNQLPVKAS